MARIVRIVSAGLLAAFCCAAANATIRAQAPASAQALPRLLENYDHAAFSAVTEQLTHLSDLKAFAAEFNDSAVPWIRAGNNDAAHRRLVAATVALEAAHAHMDDWRNARALLEWGCTLLRSTQEPQPGELAWQLTAVALAEGAYDPEDHLAHALSRFPGEPRLLLANAIVNESRTWGFDVQQPAWVEVTHVLRGESPDARMSEMNAKLMIDLGATSAGVPTAAAKSASLWALVTTFQPLTRIPEIQHEVHVRLAVTYLRLARPDLAMQALRQAATTSGDPFVDYLVHYLNAEAHQQQGHTPQAQTEYRAALAVIPQAQSSVIPLAALLFAGPARSEAIELIAGAVNVARPVDDPWRLYQAAGFHRWPELLARLRAELQ